MIKYIDYIMGSGSAIVYFTCTAAFLSVIITCSFSQHIYWDRAALAAFLWIIPTIIHIKRFLIYKENCNEFEC